MSEKTSIILCTYNEAFYIKSTIEHIQKIIPNLELIIIDDNSKDGTKDIIDQLNQEKKIKIIYRKKSRGLASALLRGIIESSGDYIGWLDTNMTESVPQFKEMLNSLKLDNDIVILSRYVEGGSDKRKLIRSLSSKYFNILCKFMLQIPIKDLTSGIFLMKREVINEVTFVASGHGEFFIEFIDNAYRKGFKIKEIPFLQFTDDKHGTSKTAPNLMKFFYLGLTYFIRIIFTILKRKKVFLRKKEEL